MRGKKGLGTRDFSISWLSPAGFVYSVNVRIEAPGARTERSPAGAGSWARGGGVQVDAEPGCCPQLTLPHSCQPAAPAIRAKGPSMRALPGLRRPSLHRQSSLRHDKHQRLCLLRSVHDGLGGASHRGRVRAAPVLALGGGSQAARAGTAALLCSSCTRVCTHADMHTRTLRPLHTFVKIRVRPVNQHNMVAGSRAPLLFMHHFKNRCLGWVHMQGY